MGDKKLGSPKETVNVGHKDASPRLLYVFLGAIICVLVVTTVLSLYHKSVARHNSPDGENPVSVRAEEALNEQPEAANALAQLGYPGDSAQQLVEWSILDDSINRLRAQLVECRRTVDYLSDQQKGGGR